MNLIGSSFSSSLASRKEARQTWTFRFGYPYLLYALAFTLLFLLTNARAFRAPNMYAIAHWLHHYEFGFIPRGAVGTLVRPLFLNKSGAEIRDIVTFFSWLNWSALVALIVILTMNATNSPRNFRLRIALASAFLVFASSSYSVFMGHLVGYFDQIVQIIAILGLLCVFKCRFLAAGVLSSIAILTHEMYVLTAMPPLFLAALLQLRGRGLMRSLLELTKFLAPPILTSLFILKAGKSGQYAHELINEMKHSGVVLDIPIVTAHLNVGFEASFKYMSPSTWGRFRRPDGLAMVAPSLLFMLFTGFILPIGKRAWIFRLLFLGTSIVPFVMLTMIWNSDTGRMVSLSLFCTFLGLVGLVKAAEDTGTKVQGDRDELLPLKDLRTTLAYVFSAIGLSVVFYNAYSKIVLMDHQIDGEGIFGFRKVGPPASYRCDRLLFRNSNFERGNLNGWNPTGPAFQRQPVFGLPDMWSRRPLNEGRYWIGTFDQQIRMGPRTTRGDNLTGEMVSRDFRIDGDYLSFLIGGGAFVQTTFVALEVEGKEVERAFGHFSEQMRGVRWDLRGWKGKMAKIRIVDHEEAAWGHINVDGFCYFDPKPIPAK